MKKYSTKKRVAARKVKSSRVTLIRFVSISAGVLFIVSIGISAIRNVSGTNVLGANTRTPYFADQEESGLSSSGLPASEGQKPPSAGDTERTSYDTQAVPTPRSLDTYNVKLPENHNKRNEESKSLEKINETLKGKNIEVGSSSANGFTIKSGDVEAETHFPLSVNPTTKTLTVTTPAGTKQVTVLPDQAVNNLLQHNIISNVSSSSGQTSGGTQMQTVNLTQVNNQPAFAIQGVSDKKLFGIFPVSLPKTVYVSAQTGQVLQTQESFLNQILSALSL